MTLRNFVSEQRERPMKILAIEHEAPEAEPQHFGPYLEAEAAQVYALYQAGVVREFYFHATQHTAILMLECPDVETARQQLSSLPLVQAGLIYFDLIPLVPYPGLARLFHKESLAG
jgi:hypothetical protein